MITIEKTQVEVEIGIQMHDLVAPRYPICRSITGNGVRETLRILQEYIPLEIIDSSPENEHLSYGTYCLPRASSKKILFPAHICHHSPVNDNLSGISLLTLLSQAIPPQNNRFSYRFLFIAETHGAITRLVRNEEKLERIKGEIVASLSGDAGSFTCKKSRQENNPIDRAVAHILKHISTSHRILEFFPYGYDERQFCSPGIDLAVSNLTRSQFGQYSEYYISDDDLQLIQPEYLAASYRVYHQKELSRNLSIS